MSPLPVERRVVPVSSTPVLELLAPVPPPLPARVMLPAPAVCTEAPESSEMPTLPALVAAAPVPIIQTLPLPASIVAADEMPLT